MNKEITLSRSEKIGWIVTVLLGLVCLVIPEQGIYTAQVKWFMAITVFSLSLAAFELVPNIMFSILMPALYIILQVAPAQVVMSPWVGSTPLMIVGAMFMATSLERSGLLKRIAYKLMCMAKGSYLTVLMVIFFSGVVINIITGGRSYLIMTALCFGLCMSLGAEKTRMGAGMAAAVMIGACTSHSYTFQATMWGNINKMSEGLADPVTPLSLLVHCWPLFAVSIFMVFLVSKLYKPEEEFKDVFSNVTYFQEELGKMGKMDKCERNNLIMISLLLVYVFTVSIHKFDLNMGFALIPWMVYLPFMKGADQNTFKAMNWDVTFFVMSCMSIGVVATSLGLGTALAQLLMTVLGGSTNIFLVLALVFGIVFGLNFLMTPMAIAALLVVPLVTIGAEMGYQALPFLYAVNACSEAILLPYEYLPYLIVYSFGMMTMKDFIKFNLLRSVVFFIGFLVVLVPYWMIIGLI